MFRTLHRWQHKLLSVFFDMPEDMEPLKNRPLQNHALQNRPLQNRPLQNRSLADLHSRAHEPQVLKGWQTSIRNFVEQHFAKR